MSKQSREQARQTRQKPAFPKGIAAIGLVAVVVVAIVAAKMLTGTPRAASVDGAAGPQPVALANSTTNTASNTVSNTASTTAASGRQLLFFMNPDGYPCQQQLGILNSVADSLSKVAQVVYIKTTEPADLQKFEAFGIRALPSLIIADQNGRELSRLSPGIQSGDAVLAALSR